jgi:uncharacterized protein YdeI (YjbR/CyaY-like superfamily)
MQFPATLETEGRTATGINVPAEVVDPQATFDGLSYSNRSWHVLQIEGARSEETRQRRIGKSIEALAAGKVR